MTGPSRNSLQRGESAPPEAGALIERAREVNTRALALYAEKTKLLAVEAELRHALRQSRALTYEAQAREAATRSNLTEVLRQTLVGRSEALASARAAVADGHFAPPPTWRGRTALFRLLERAGYLQRKLPPLFDAPFYTGRHRDELAAARMGAVAHYVAVGQTRGDDPHPLFDVRHYASQGPKPARGEHLVSHYLREGWRLGLSPHPLFDPAWYVGQLDDGAPKAPPLIHYLEQGWREGLSPHPLFDPAWYLDAHPDVAAAGAEPLSHFLAHGAAEERAPNPWFDIAHYRQARGGALAPDRNPLVDYLDGGAWAVAEPMPGFATGGYLAAHPELASEGVTPLEHWLARRHGGEDDAADA